MEHSPGFLAIVDDAKSRVAEITIDEISTLQSADSPYTLIDVREDNEWTAGRAKGAIHLGKGIIERDIEKTIPDTGQLIVLYCGGGFRSALAGDALQRMGYRNVRSLAGGWRAWTAAGLPTEC